MATFVELIHAVLEEMSEGPHPVVNKTTAAGTTAILEDTDNLKETSSAADANRHDGWWLRFWDSAETPIENIRKIKTYTPSDGRLVPEANFDNAPGDNKVYELHQRMHPTKLKTCITDALAELRYQDILPLTLVVNGDMEVTLPTTDWKENAISVVAYDTTKVLFGTNSLKVVDDGLGTGGGYASMEAGYLAVTPGEKLIVWAAVYGDQQGARLTLYDVTNSADIETARHDEEGWGLLFFTATVPEDCLEVDVHLETITKAGTTYWDHVGILKVNQRVYDSPGWLTKRQDFIKVISFPRGKALTSDDADNAYSLWARGPQHEHTHETIFAHRGVVPLRIPLSESPSKPLFVIGKRRYPALSTDIDTTAADATIVKAGALAFAYRRLGDAYRGKAAYWAYIFDGLRRGDEPPLTVRQRSCWR